MLLPMLILVGVVVVMICLVVFLFKTELAIRSASNNQQELEHEAREFVKSGGKAETGWFYDYRGDDPFIDNYGSSSGGHGNRRWQFDCYYENNFWFKQYEFSKFPYTEESLQQTFSEGTLAPEGDAPTDLDILRGVEGRP